jgi:DNA-binding NarL/FixJ family response regulator
MPASTVRALVFSPAALFREGLCSLLEQSGAVERVVGAGDWSAVLNHLRRGEADAVIIDRDGTNPDALVDALFEVAPRIRVILVSSQDNRLAVFMQSPVDESYRPQLIAAVAQIAPVP